MKGWGKQNKAIGNDGSANGKNDQDQQVGNKGSEVQFHNDSLSEISK